MFWEILLPSLSDGVRTIAPLALLVGLLIYSVAFIQATLIERRIRKLYKERDEKIQAERKRPVAQEFIDGMTAKHMRDYGEQIEPLERERRFILDKIPLLKQ